MQILFKNIELKTNFKEMGLKRHEIPLFLVAPARLGIVGQSRTIFVKVGSACDLLTKRKSDHNNIKRNCKT